MSLKSNYEYIRDWCNHRFLKKSDQVKVDLSNYYTKNEVDSQLSNIDLSEYATQDDLSNFAQFVDNNKQNVISDLETIRTNAANGAAKISNVQSDWNASSGEAAILNKPDLSAYLTVSDYQSDEEVVAASLNDLNSRIKTVEDVIKVTSNGDVFVVGIGGYDGTNADTAQSLQAIITQLSAR